jgi:hypothetical protein
VTVAAGTCEFVVGRLLEVHMQPLRTVEDVTTTSDRFAQAVGRLPRDAKFSIAADWRAVHVMPPETAAATRAMLARANPRIVRSAILTLPENPTTNLQVIRIIREAQGYDRHHFTDPAVMHRWLSEVISPEESARLRVFLELPSWGKH